MADEQDLEIKLEDIDGGTKSARRKLGDYKKAIEALQKNAKQNPFKGYGAHRMVCLFNGVAMYCDIPSLVAGNV